MPTLEGDLSASGLSFAIVVSRFNELVTDRLRHGAVHTLNRAGVADGDITTVHVPGSFEIPIVADRLAASGRFAGVICLGAVIQGQTTHHEYINAPVASTLMAAGVRHGVPIGFGILTCQSMEQALDRAGGKVGNKGHEATLAVIEAASVLRKIDESGS